MNCSQNLIECYLDNELDVEQHAAVQQHLSECVDCSGTYALLSKQMAEIRSAAPHYTAPPELLQSIRDGLRRWRPEPAKSVAEAPWRWLALAATVLLVASVSWNVVQMRSHGVQSDMAEMVLTDHIRSLIGTHLVDVPSSDQHTVKPWFAGKLNFSPDVRELAAQGFPLEGGRMEYLNGRRAAALVYRRRLHVINLFIWPVESSGDPDLTVSRSGYNLIHWSDGPMTYWAVSDVGAAELATLRALYK